MTDERPQPTPDRLPARDPDALGAARRDQEMLEEFPGPELADPWLEPTPEAPSRQGGVGS